MFRKLLIILMLVFMPLQLSWAGLVTYCEHETGAAANHMGHHVDLNERQAKNVDSDADEKNTGHIECGICHIAYLVADIGRTTFFSEVVIKTYASQYVVQMSVAPANRLERPQWRHFA